MRPALFLVCLGALPVPVTAQTPARAVAEQDAPPPPAVPARAVPARAVPARAVPARAVPAPTLPPESPGGPVLAPVLQRGGGPPAITVIEGVSGGRLLVRQTEYFPTTQTRTRLVSETITEADGRQRQVTKPVQETYTVMAPRILKVEYELAGVRAFNTNGEAIPTDQLARMYARPGLALLATPGVAVDPAYLKIARDGVPLIAPSTPPLLPPAEALPPPAPAPPPAPEAAPPPAPAAEPVPPPAVEPAP